MIWAIAINNDPSEKYEIGENNPEIIAVMTKKFEKQLSKIKPLPRQMDSLMEGPLKDYFRKIMVKKKGN